MRAGMVWYQAAMARHGPQTVLSNAAHDGLGVLAAQGLLGGVVAAALAAQDQKAIQACPVVHSPGKAARAVWRLARPRDRKTLRRLFAVDDSVQIVGHRALLRVIWRASVVHGIQFVV